MNDTYLTEGSIGHLPDLCSTVPVFHEGEIVGYIQAFGHHDDVGGCVPGSMPSTAESVFEEGLAVPPIRIYSEGKRKDDAFKIIRRNNRLPESLSADLDSEVQACIMGAKRLEELFGRFGRDEVEAWFQAIIEKCRETFRNELLPKIADGEYVWHDYVEHDVGCEVKLHKIALKMIKSAGRISLDFSGTDPQSDGPLNWPADSPERAAEIHVNEGVCKVFDIIFPEKGTLLTPIWPAPTNARSFVLLRTLSLLGGVVAQAVDGKMPADQEAIRYTGFYGFDLAGKPFLSREVLGGAPAGAPMRVAMAPSISCRTRETSQPSSPKPL